MLDLCAEEPHEKGVLALFFTPILFVYQELVGRGMIRWLMVDVKREKNLEPLQIFFEQINTLL